ncbi:hypothetical protein FI667_g5664, partial [Globisporangium splendens]
MLFQNENEPMGNMCAAEALCLKLFTSSHVATFSTVSFCSLRSTSSQVHFFLSPHGAHTRRWRLVVAEALELREPHEAVIDERVQLAQPRRVLGEAHEQRLDHGRDDLRRDRERRVAEREARESEEHGVARRGQRREAHRAHDARPAVGTEQQQATREVVVDDRLDATRLDQRPRVVCRDVEWLAVPCDVHERVLVVRTDEMLDVLGAQRHKAPREHGLVASCPPHNVPDYVREWTQQRADAHRAKRTGERRLQEMADDAAVHGTGIRRIRAAAVITLLLQIGRRDVVVRDVLARGRRRHVRRIVLVVPDHGRARHDDGQNVLENVGCPVEVQVHVEHAEAPGRDIVRAHERDRRADPARPDRVHDEDPDRDGRERRMTQQKVHDQLEQHGDKVEAVLRLDHPRQVHDDRERHDDPEEERVATLHRQQDDREHEQSERREHTRTLEEPHLRVKREQQHPPDSKQDVDHAQRAQRHANIARVQLRSCGSVCFATLIVTVIHVVAADRVHCDQREQRVRDVRANQRHVAVRDRAIERGQRPRTARAVRHGERDETRVAGVEVLDYGRQRQVLHLGLGGVRARVVFMVVVAALAVDARRVDAQRHAPALRGK